jgi:hypothetical protein
MLRTLVALLILLNVLFLAWTQGWLGPLQDSIGMRPEGDREPLRLKQQVHPERIQLLPPERASAASAARAPASDASANDTAASASATCLEAGPFAAAEIPQLQAALAMTLPTGSWSLRELERGANWQVAMGPYPSVAAAQKKREELHRLGITPQDAASAPVALEIVLGSFETEGQAKAHLEVLGKRGVNSAHVEETPAAQEVTVKRADTSIQSALTAAQDRFMGRSFGPCKTSV